MDTNPTPHNADHVERERRVILDALALTGTRLQMRWDGSDAYVSIDEAGTSVLGFHRCEPSWVATWTFGNLPCADADALLLPGADGPETGAPVAEVGRWMNTVIRALAGRRPAGESYRNWKAEGFTTGPQA